MIGLLPRPKNNSQFKDHLKDVNFGLLDISRRHEGCTFIPVHKLFLDPQPQDHQVAPGFHVQDEVHLNHNGGTILGEYIFKRLMILK